MKVLIIIPAYNVEKYLFKCVESVLTQSYQNFEIIIVNDGSADNTYECMKALQNKDSRWSDIFMTSMFLGMISAFLGMVFADIRKGITGLIPIFVLLVSAAVMGICGILIKKCNMKWLETYAMAISMVVAMIFAAVITPILA